MPTYTYRRDLDRSDTLKAIGIGVGAGLGTALAVVYVARRLLQRAPLRDAVVAPGPRAPVIVSPELRGPRP